MHFKKYMNIKKYVFVFVYVIGLIVTINMVGNQVPKMDLSDGIFNLITYYIVNTFYYTMIFLFFLKKSKPIYNDLVKQEAGEFFGEILGFVIISLISSALFVGFLVMVTSENFKNYDEGSSYLITYYALLKIGMIFTVLLINSIFNSLNKKTDTIKNNVIPINSNRKEG